MRTVKPRFAPARQRFGQAPRAALDLARLSLCLSAFASAIVSYWLATRRFDPLSLPALAAALAVACAVGFANALNDIIDVEVDRVNNSRRPIPSGRISQRAAAWLAGLLGAASLGLGLLAGGRMALLAAFALLASLAYDLWARNVPILGNAIVALLGALTLAAGFMVVEAGAFPAAPFVCSFLFILGREFAGTVCDLAGDREGGRRSVAMLWGPRATLLASLALAACSALAMIAAAWLQPAARPAAYLACAAATSIAPTLAAAAAIWRDQRPENIRVVSGRLKYVLMFTTLSFLLLV
jgi:4-hydroxybenzoate polyprenyltransferase